MTLAEGKADGLSDVLPGCLVLVDDAAFANKQGLERLSVYEQGIRDHLADHGQGSLHRFGVTLKGQHVVEEDL